MPNFTYASSCLDAHERDRETLIYLVAEALWPGKELNKVGNY
jgi:hypothetical protein